MLRIDDLQNKSVLVTGASGGIGAAVAHAFALQGARVAVHWNTNSAAADTVVRGIRDAGGSCFPVQGDLAHRGGPKRVVEEAATALGGIDVLINNSGSLVSRQAILEADEDWIDSVIAVNAKAAIAAC